MGSVGGEGSGGGVYGGRTEGVVSGGGKEGGGRGERGTHFSSSSGEEPSLSVT